MKPYFKCVYIVLQNPLAYSVLHFYLILWSKTTERMASFVTWPQKASPTCFSDTDGWDSPICPRSSSRVAKRRLSRESFLWELSSRIDLTLSPHALREGGREGGGEREREREEMKRRKRKEYSTGGHLIKICTYSLARSTISWGGRFKATPLGWLFTACCRSAREAISGWACRWERIEWRWKWILLLYFDL